jgi:hypothetical protein
MQQVEHGAAQLASVHVEAQAAQALAVQQVRDELEAELTSRHEASMAAVRSEHEASIASLRSECAAELEAAVRAATSTTEQSVQLVADEMVSAITRTGSSVG